MKREIKKLSEKLSNPKSLAKFLQQPSIEIAEAITGILASDLKDYKLIAGRIIQGAVKLRLFSQLGKELRELQEKGKIKEDYFATHKQQATLVELLKFIDEEVPDEELFKAIKSIFFTSISKDASDEDEILGYELLKICKELKSADILVLKACHKTPKDKTIVVPKDVPFIAETNAKRWQMIVSQILKLPGGLIEIAEDNLIRLKLLSGRKHSDHSGVQPGPNGRLTDLGVSLCEFITKYPS